VLFFPGEGKDMKFGDEVRELVGGPSSALDKKLDRQTLKYATYLLVLLLIPHPTIFYDYRCCYYHHYHSSCYRDVLSAALVRVDDSTFDSVYSEALAADTERMRLLRRRGAA
jgi:hypothetical protein